jgi:hypothetical protein
LSLHDNLKFYIKDNSMKEVGFDKGYGEAQKEAENKLIETAS